MKNITIVALNGAVDLSIVGPMDIFRLVGVLWNQIHNLPSKPYFHVEIVAEKVGSSAQREDSLIYPKKQIEEVESTDLIILPSVFGDIDSMINTNQKIIPWLKKHYQRGAAIAGMCTGAFLLAETGLLEGKSATTHWGFAPVFEERYPKVKFKPEQIITDEGDLFCSGGATASLDLSLYLVEKYVDHEIALQCSKSLLIDRERTNQSPYLVLASQVKHKDRQISKVQKWIEERYSENHSLETIALQFGMSVRSLIRRFKAVTGESPLSYLQRVRVEIAKQALEREKLTFEEITFKVGYEDVNFFRQLFKRHTSITPNAYRKKFQPYHTR